VDHGHRLGFTTKGAEAQNQNDLQALIKGRCRSFRDLLKALPVSNDNGMSPFSDYLLPCPAPPVQHLPSDPQQLDVAHEFKEKVTIATAPIRMRIFFISTKTQHIFRRGPAIFHLGALQQELSTRRNWLMRNSRHLLPEPW
jgi:hypothetical protein